MLIRQSAHLVGICGSLATQLLQVLVGLEKVEASEGCGAGGSGSTKKKSSITTTTLPITTSIPPPPPHAESDSSVPSDQALQQLLTSVVHDYLGLGKPDAIANWVTVIHVIVIRSFYNSFYSFSLFFFSTYKFILFILRVNCRKQI